MKKTTLLFTLLLMTTITQSVHSSSSSSSSASSNQAVERLKGVNLYEQRSGPRKFIDTLKHHSGKLALTSLAAAAALIAYTACYDELNVKKIFATPTLLLCAASLPFFHIYHQINRLLDGVNQRSKEWESIKSDENKQDENKQKAGYPNDQLYVDKIKNALWWGADVHVKVKYKVQIVDRNDKCLFFTGSLLHAVAVNEWIDGMILLFEYGADPNARVYDDATPLPLMVSCIHEADPNARVRYGATPLMVSCVAVQRENYDKDQPVIKALLEYGADPNKIVYKNNCEYTLLQNLVEMQFVKAIELVLKYGANVEKMTPTFRYTPLMIAVWEGTCMVVNTGCLHNATDWVVKCPVSATSIIIEMLLQYDANVKVQTCVNKYTLLHIAAGKEIVYNSHERRDLASGKEIVKILMQYYEDGIFVKDAYGLEPLFCFIDNGWSDIIESLLLNQTYVKRIIDVKNAKKESLLYYTIQRDLKHHYNDKVKYPCIASKENIKIIECLLKAGANVNETNVKGEKLLDIAMKKGCKETVKVLSQSENINVDSVMKRYTVHDVLTVDCVELVECLKKKNFFKDADVKEIMCNIRSPEVAKSLIKPDAFKECAVELPLMYISKQDGYCKTLEPYYLEQYKKYDIKIPEVNNTFEFVFRNVGKSKVYIED